MESPFSTLPKPTPRSYRSPLSTPRPRPMRSASGPSSPGLSHRAAAWQEGVCTVLKVEFGGVIDESGTGWCAGRAQADEAGGDDGCTRGNPATWGWRGGMGGGAHGGHEPSQLIVLPTLDLSSSFAGVASLPPPSVLGHRI
jgi:hypothetical protein